MSRGLVARPGGFPGRVLRGKPVRPGRGPAPPALASSTQRCDGPSTARRPHSYDSERARLRSPDARPGRTAEAPRSSTPEAPCVGTTSADAVPTGRSPKTFTVVMRAHGTVALNLVAPLL